MQDLVSNNNDSRTLLVIRVGNGTLSFSVGNPQAVNRIVFEPYNVNNAISMAANLRNAFGSSELLMSGYRRALVMVVSPVLLVPKDEFVESQTQTLYAHTFTEHGDSEIVHSLLPDLNAMAVFGIDKDLKAVVDEHFVERSYIPVVQPVWLHLYRRNFSGMRDKLYVYFHDGNMDVFCYAQNRFRFCNTFDATHAHDALYYLLYVWRQMGYSVDNDELYLCGEVPDKDWFRENLGRHIKRVYTIKPSADFNRAPIASMSGVAYDLMALHLK